MNQGNFKERGESLKKLFKRSLLRQNLSTDISKRASGDRIFQHLDKENSGPKNELIRELLDRERRRLPSLKDYWSHSRDISHLKDPRDRLSLHSFLNLPTDIDSLQCQSLSSAKDTFFDTVLSPTKAKNMMNTVERLSLGKPSGRQDIENLKQWYDLMKQKHIKNKDLEDQESFDTSELIYITCLKEIIRQVAVHCMDRGKLLKEVVEKLISLYKDKKNPELIDPESDNLKLEISDLKSQMSEVIESYENKTITLYDKINEYMKDINTQKDTLKITQSHLENVKFKLQCLQRKYDVKSSAIDKLIHTFNAKKLGLNPKFVQFVQEIDLEGKDSDNLQPHQFYRDSPINQFSIKNILKKRASNKNAPNQALQDVTNAQETQDHIKNRRAHDRLGTHTEENSHIFGTKLEFDEPLIDMSDLYHDKETQTEKMYFIHPRYAIDISPTEVLSNSFCENLPKHKVSERYKSCLIFPNTNSLSTGEVKETDQSIDLFKVRSKNQRANSFGGQLNRSLDKLSDFNFTEGYSDRELSEESFYETANDTLIKSSKNSKTKRSKIKNSKTQLHKQPTKFVEFNWKRKKEGTNLFRKTNIGNLVLQNLLAKPLETLKKKGSMTKRMVNKLISNVLQLCKIRNDEPLIEVMHEVFTNRYVLKSVAERKFSDMICSLLMYAKGRRKLFLQFIGAGFKLGSKNYSKHSFSMFLTVYDFMLNAKVGINVHNDEFLDNTSVPAVRALECVKEKLEHKIEKSEANKLYLWIEKNSIQDHKKINTGGLVNLDRFLIHFIQIYDQALQEVREFVYNMFQGVSCERSFVTSMEIGIMLRFINTRKKEEYDQESDLTHSLRKYNFEELFNLFIEKNYINIKDVKRLERYQVSLDIEQDREMLDEILHKIDSQGTCKTLDTSVLRQRLNFLQESQGLLKNSIIFLGWSLFSSEINRINEEI